MGTEAWPRVRLLLLLLLWFFFFIIMLEDVLVLIVLGGGKARHDEDGDPDLPVALSVCQVVKCFWQFDVRNLPSGRESGVAG